MTVTRVIAFGIPGDQKAVSAFNKYCQANKEKLDKTNICFVSLKRVYKSNYPPFISTKVIYRCRFGYRLFMWDTCVGYLRGTGLEFQIQNLAL
ncbi:hypothetical protein QZH41_004457 [Actinostola sp. cb2023]|nr:hypothetical protein QZH41_004457 [Actinostola sp. cb2023]